MGDDYKKQFKTGDRLILELKSKEIFEGIYADGGKDRIVLAEVLQHNNKNKLTDLYEFYRSEIAKIHTLKVPSSKPSNGSTSQDTDSQSPSKSGVIKISEEEYFRYKDMSRNYIYIENADKRYFDAVKVLGDCETIGVLSVGMEKHRSGSFIRLLVLSTWKQVYIFDLLNLENRQLYPEIKDIFQSEFVCKVIHKSAGLVDVLYRQYNVYLRNTFDTNIVDLILQKKLTGKCPPIERDISQCLTHYLNFPASLLEHALNVPSKKWQERPLSDKLKSYASQLATYLILLKEQFQKLLLKEVYETIDKVQDHVYDLDDFEFLNYNNKMEVPKGVQKLIPNFTKMSVNE